MMTAKEGLEAAKGVTFEDIWAILQETAKGQEESVKRHKEINEILDRTAKRQEETAKRCEEIAKLQEETDKQQKLTDKQQKLTDRQLMLTDRQVKRLSKNIGGISSSLGKWVEKMVSGKLWEKFNDAGYVFTKGGPCKFIEDNRVFAQVDVFLENGEYAMPVEVKVELAEDDVDDHIERIEKLRHYMDKRNDKRKLVGAVAGAIVPESVMNYAFKKGLYVLVQSGKSIALAEQPEKFQVQAW
ncbi:MAG: hypothetical protein LBL64_02635 [Treponema sp.]|jgi:hypothetical protein|nr:hypothetical protein [Treponema sp.]